MLCADSHKAGTVYAGDYVNHGMCKMKLNEDLIESVGLLNVMFQYLVSTGWAKLNAPTP